jgi:hypothetical protein
LKSIDLTFEDSSLRLEQKLVLACVSLDRGKDECIRDILKRELDWQYLSQIALQQGVFPLFYQRLKAAAERQIPSAEIAHYNHWFHANTQNCYRLSWKLIQFADLLSSKGIETIVLKGPVIALQAFGDIALRRYTDLDVLIHEEDFPRVYELLCQSGYSPIFELGSKQIKFQLRSDNHFSFNRQGDVLEVHWKIGPQENIYPTTPEQMWQGLYPILVLEREFSALSPENTVLFACLHGAKHGWRQLKWIVDLAYLCQSFTGIDWYALLEQAKGTGLFRQVCIGLLLSEGLVGATIPSKMGDLIHADQPAQQLASQVRSRLFDIANAPGQFEDYGFYLQTRERWRDRVYYLFNMTFVPKQTDWVNFTLPELLYPIYYLFRPLRLLANITLAAFSALFK